MLTMAYAENLGYEINGSPVFTGVDFAINPGDRVGLVGRNGIGKTTLLQLMHGEIEPTSGKFHRGDEEIGMMPQNLSDWLNHTVKGFIETVTGVAQARQDFEKSYETLGTKTDPAALSRYAAALERYERLAVSDFDLRLIQALSQAQIQEIDVSQEIGALSGGQKTRVALAALFASNHDIILLDEPTNNLDMPGVVLLEKFIGNSNASFVIVSHDRRFLRGTTNRIIELVGGKEGVKQYGLGYDEYTEARQQEERAIAKRYDQYEDEKKRLRIAARQANIRANSASISRQSPDNDKFAANYRKQRAAQNLGSSGAALKTRIDQLEEPDRPDEEIRLALNFGQERQKKYTLLNVDSLTVRLPGANKIVGPVSLRIQNGDRVIIAGENGVGKTTLLKAIVGELTAHTGTVTFGRSTRMMHVDQNQTPPDSSKPALENLRLIAPHLETHDAIKLLLQFGLKKDILQTVPAANLSGGERAKLLLAGVAAKQANLLILDEPTNNLDIPSIEALEDALKTYTGSVIMVSHDRDFIDAIRPDRKVVINNPVRSRDTVTLARSQR